MTDTNIYIEQAKHAIGLDYKNPYHRGTAKHFINRTEIIFAQQRTMKHGLSYRMWDMRNVVRNTTDVLTFI